MTNYTYNPANQLSSGGATYDNNGNLTNDGTNSYTWDRANRLLSMGGASYKYDGLNNRIQQTVGANVTKYLLDLQPGLTVVLSETTGANVIRNVHSPRGIHAQKDVGGAWEWMVQDGLGSVRGVVDNSVDLLWSVSPAPYGEYFDETGTRQTNYGFTGEPTDGTGLVYLRARYYNPAAGVFTALDPFEGVPGRPMSLNGYSWVEGNTPNLTDPSGKCGQPTNWLDPFDANCRYSAEGLARRFSNGDSSLYQTYFNILIQQAWGDLKAVEAKLSGDDLSGFIGYVGDRASIIPKLFVENPGVAWQALLEYFNSCSSNSPQAAGMVGRVGAIPGQRTGVGTRAPTGSGGGSGHQGLITLLLALIAAGVTILEHEYTRDRIRDEEQAKDFIWRGIESTSPKAREFRPRAPKDPMYDDLGDVIEANARDFFGLSFFEGRTNMWLSAPEQFRKAYRTGFTEAELVAAGFSVFPDDIPPGHRAIKRINPDEWDAWLYAEANQPGDIYSQVLATMATTLGRTEPNVAPG